MQSPVGSLHCPRCVLTRLYVLHRSQRKSKEAEYLREWKAKNPEKAKAGFADGEEKTDAVRQDESFENRMGEILYVADASKMITCAPVTMGKVQDTKFVQNMTT